MFKKHDGIYYIFQSHDISFLNRFHQNDFHSWCEEFLTRTDAINYLYLIWIKILATATILGANYWYAPEKDPHRFREKSFYLEKSLTVKIVCPHGRKILGVWITGLDIAQYEKYVPPRANPNITECLNFCYDYIDYALLQ